MSLDKSLRSRGELVRHRNVLSRTERLQMLKDAGRWDDEKPVFGLPKVAHRKIVTKKIKAAVAVVEGAEGAAAVPGAAPAAGAAPAGAAKPGAAPAAKAPAAKAPAAKAPAAAKAGGPKK